ncbi:hypothetical protein GEMRC1_013055 [Eukaryota sp. GEM-RC1]
MVDESHIQSFQQHQVEEPQLSSHPPSLPVQVLPYSFQFYTPNSSPIHLAGSFSAWNLIEMLYDDHDHCHRLVLNIPTGERHQFKFTDGKQWFLGKYDTTTDEHGNMNNILTM